MKQKVNGEAAPLLAGYPFYDYVEDVLRAGLIKANKIIDGKFEFTYTSVKSCQQTQIQKIIIQESSSGNENRRI